MSFNWSRVNFHLPTRVRFGPGVVGDLGAYLTGLGAKRLMVLSDPGLAKTGLLDKVLAPLRAQDFTAEVFTDIPTNPGLACVEAALAVARSATPDALVSVGGGSPIDVGKAVALLLTNEGPLARYQWEGNTPEKPSLAHVAVPTTAGTGSEVSRTAVIVDRGTKRGIVSDVLFPAAAFIDPELALSLPPGLTAATGVDALTHAIEAYVGKNINAFTGSLAARAVGLVASSLRRACADGSDLEARSRLAMGSTLAGIAMDQSGLGIIHSLSGPLSAWYNVHHGLSNAIFLPESIRFNAPAAAASFAELAVLMGLPAAWTDSQQASAQFAAACAKLIEDVGVASLPPGMVFTEGEIDKMADAAAEMFLARNNPRPVTAADCGAIYRKVLRVKA